MISNDYIELMYTKNYFGYPVCVYRFKKHDELKDELLKRVTIDSMSNGNYIRSVPDAKPILEYTDNHAISELRTAYQKAYDHFYTDVLDCDLSFDDEDKPYKTLTKSKPIITQSWFVRVPPINNVKNENGDSCVMPMSMHTHFLSPVCGAYYLSIERQVGDGGNLVFGQPQCDHMLSYVIRDCLRAKGSIKYYEIHEIHESEIVLWAGVLPHTIEAQRNMSSERVSIITNSIVTPLMNGHRTYNYNMSAFNANGEYYTDE